MANIVRDLPTMKKFEFPVYEVITPHTNHSFTIRSMTVDQESVIKESSVSPVKLDTIISQTIFDCIENKKAPFNTLEGFEKNLTYRDREALIFGLIIASYGETQKYNYKCPNCEKEFEVEINLAENADVKIYDGSEDLINKEVTIDLPVSKYKAVVKLPSLFESKALYNIKGVDKSVIDKMSEYNIVKRLIVPGYETDKTGEKIEKNYVIDKLIEIYSTIKSLPARDRKAIQNAVIDMYGKYRLAINIPTTCPNCGHEFETNLDVTQELFRNLQ